MKRPVFQHSSTPALLGVATGLLIFLLPSTSRSAEVSARLEIPAEETHVIGDPVPLVWHFTNATERPLAFVWEACCRLNGRMEIRRNGELLPTIPPGPSSAHQFAKPAILRPHGEQRFESLLADWAFLTNSGRYELSGRYIGVVPEQKPPVPASIALWRDQAITPPTPVTLWTVADYFAQRPDRVARRGLDARMTGSATLPALGSATFAVEIRNVSSNEVSLRWPLDADLWLVDAGGLRIFRSPTKPDVATKTLAIPAGGSVQESFALAVDDLNSAPFGDYGVFIDFPERDGQPRVPSTRHEVQWRPDATETAQLLVDAAEGRSVGARNAPLRRLRQYLASFAPIMEGISATTLSEVATQLRTDLLQANCLRDLSTRTGRATLATSVARDGSWKVTEPAVVRCLEMPPADQLRQITALRRHLGWEIAVRLYPDPEIEISRLAAAARTIASTAPDLATPPRVIGDAPTNQVAGTVSFPAVAAPSSVVFRLEPGPSRDTDSFVVRLPQGERRLTSPAELSSLLRELGPALQPVVTCPPQRRWRDLEPWLAPFLERGLQVDLVPFPTAEPSR